MSMRYPGGFISSTAPTVNANTAKGVWTLEQAMQYAKAGLWPVPTGNGDPYFQNNTLLLPGQGTNGANNNTFLDSSSNNFTITRNGNTTQGTFTPFSQANGYWSNYFDGGDALSLSNSTPLNLSGVSYTIEGWINPDGNYANYNIIIAKRNSPNNADCPWEVYQAQTSGALGFYNGTVYVSQTTPPARQWSHFAAVFDGGNINLYLNGTRVLVSAITNYDSAVPIYIGSFTPLNEDYIGHISNIRITKGAALYTGDTFSVPTSALTTTVPSGTVSLLTCQSNRFIDNSVNAATLTVNGAPKVSSFEPLGAPTTTYSPSTVGGSGYFDGSSDYLTWSSGSSVAFGTGNFTVECWFYVSTSGLQYLFDARNAGQTNAWAMHITPSSGNIVWFNGSADWTVNTTLRLNSWNHIAYVRETTTGSMFLNGVRLSTQTDSTNYSVSPTTSTIAARYNNVENVNGYLADARIVKGTAVYSGATYTVPTAPLTNIANTSLLLNFTNAGIIDNTEKNDLETVGNAQISSGQYKWGGSSIYLSNGETGPIVVPNSNLFNLGAGDFTIETWIYIVTNQTYNYILSKGGASTREWAVGVGPSSIIFYWTTGGTSASQVLISATVTIPLDTWMHVAVTRVGTTIKLFLNGNEVGKGTFTSMYSSTAPMYIGRFMDYNNISHGLTGYLADMRITRGYARYLYSFNNPTAAFPLFYQAAAAPSADPYFENVTMLLPGNGTNGGQNNTFLDSSTNAFTITRNGNTTQGTFTPFSQSNGYWSNYLDGSGDYLYIGTNSQTAFQSNNFTIEFWGYFTNASANALQTFYSNYTVFNNAGSIFFGKHTSGGGAISVFLSNYSTSTPLLTEPILPPSNTWTHYALVKNGSIYTIYRNGVATVSATFAGASTGSTNPSYIGVPGDATNNYWYTGYMSNFRIVNGTAVYTSNFTPSTSPLTAIANTAVLTCQSNRFIDNSTNAFSITVAGNPQVQAFVPFNPTAAYSTSTVGGSGYFDGTGDYLALSNVSALQPGASTTPFCIECWAYPTAVPGVDTAVYGNFKVISYPGNCDGFDMLFNTAGKFAFRWGYPTYADSGQSAAAFINGWNHIVVARNSSGSLSCYLNGTRWFNTSSNTNITTPTAASMWVGWAGSLSGTTINPFIGYISGFRFTKGSTPYDPTQSTLTLPTTPPTAITDTQLLCNFTNASITDAAAKNDLETVGGVSTSTTQSKFGGSSMYFDGSGDYLIMPDILTGQFGTGDFTIEYWDYHGTQGTNYADQVGTLSSGTPAGTWRFGTFTNGGGLYFSYHNGSSYVDVQFGSVAYNDTTWRHFAISRYNGVLYAFVNGIQVGAATACTQDFNSSNRVILGAELVNPTYFAGYLQDVRITKGVARYVTNFTPPSTALPLL